MYAYRKQEFFYISEYLKNRKTIFEIAEIDFIPVLKKTHSYIKLKPLTGVQASNLSKTKNSCPEVFFKKVILENFTKFTRKNLRCSFLV